MLAVKVCEKYHAISTRVNANGRADWRLCGHALDDATANHLVASIPHARLARCDGSLRYVENHLGSTRTDIPDDGGGWLMAVANPGLDSQWSAVLRLSSLAPSGDRSPADVARTLHGRVKLAATLCNGLIAAYDELLAGEARPPDAATP